MKRLVMSLLMVYFGTFVIIFAEVYCIMSFALVGGVQEFAVPGRPWWLQISILSAIMSLAYWYPVAKVLNVLKKKQ